jgi:hypothetical protein
MINFFKLDDKLIFSYTPEQQENWVSKAFEKRKSITFRKTFTFNQKDTVFIEDSSKDIEDSLNIFDEFESTHFVFATLQGDYYKVKKGIIIDTFDLFIHKEIHPKTEFFVADLDVSIFSIIKRMSTQPFYIGGDHPTAIPTEDFEKLLQHFPKSYERRKYVEARVSSILRNYIENVKDAERSYEKYLNKKLSKKGVNLIKTFQDLELYKYQTIYDKLKQMLENEIQYNERHWQEEMLQIILLIYPKYIFVFKEVPM